MSTPPPNPFDSPQYGYQPGPPPPAQPFGAPQAPYGQPPFPPQPGPGPEPRKPTRMGCFGWGVIAICVVIVVGILGVLLLSGPSTKPSDARVGDCIHAVSMTAGSTVQRIKCSDLKANYVVVKRFTYDGFFSTNSCQNITGVTAGYHGTYYTKTGKHRIKHTYLLCLAPHGSASATPARTY